jgi:hypothetical protein
MTPQLTSGASKSQLKTLTKSNSILILVSMPVALWCHLPDTNAHRFVDFITSGSIVPRTFGLQDVVRQPTVGQLQTFAEGKDEKIVQSEALSRMKEDVSAQKEARIEHNPAELRAFNETTRTRETELYNQGNRMNLPDEPMRNG